MNKKEVPEKQVADPEIQDAISRVLAGETEYFEMIIEKYRKAVIYIAYSIVRDQDAVEDVVQETFLRAYKFLDKYKPHCRFITWLLTIARNQSIEWVNKRKKNKDLSNELKKYSQPYYSISFSFDEDSEKLDRGLRKLKESERLLLIMRFYCRLSYFELSELFEIRENNVRIRVFRALKRLTAIIETLS